MSFITISVLPGFVNGLFLCSILGFFLWIYRWRKSSPSPPFLPGPEPKWLVGNLFDIPTQSPWLVFTEWSRIYDVFSLRALGNSIVVLNTLESVTHLLDKRGNIYSDRPKLTMGGELMGLDQTTGMCAYGNTWREHRKLSRLALAPDVVKKYIPIQEKIAGMYLRALMETPEDFIAHLRLAAGRIVMTTTYGLTINNADEEYITETEAALERVNRALVPGAYLVDLIPSLKHLPRWFPFASFLTEADDSRRQVVSVVTRPFEQVKRNMILGNVLPSFTSFLLSDLKTEQHESRDKAEETIKWAAGSMYGAGGETTFAAVLTFMLAMALYPDKQAAAQAELDRVVGPNRLPEVGDEPMLPYVAALIKETLRWHVVLPLGIARRATQYDVYNGYAIPCGSVVIPNVWAIAVDEKCYEAPEDFIPERFLDANKCAPDPFTYSFGFGRRICPGRHLAANSLFILITSILASFRISKQLDENGNEVPLEPSFTKGLVSYPEPFECAISPRSARAAEMIMNRTAQEYDSPHVLHD